MLHVVSDEIRQDATGNEFRMQRTACPVCGPQATASLGKRGGPHQKDRKGIETDVLSCLECGMIWPDPFPVPVNPSGLYGDPAKYFPRTDARSDREQISHFRAVVGRAKTITGKRKPSILDVGSGRAQMILAAAELGCRDVVGLEFAQGMLDYAARIGIDLVPETIEQYAKRTIRTFDFVCLSAIIEHVHDPDSMIAAASKLTRPGAALYVDAPNEQSLVSWLLNWTSRIRGSESVYNLSPTWAPFHVWGFSERPLRRLLSKHGFEVVSLRKYSEMGLTYPPGFRGASIKAAAKAVGALANVTGTASNMYCWARRV